MYYQKLPYKEIQKRKSNFEKSGKNIPTDIRKAIHTRDKHTCQICGEEGNSLHHIVFTRTKNKKVHIKENLMLLCDDCHRKVHRGKYAKGLQVHCVKYSYKKYGNVIFKLIEELKNEGLLAKSFIA